MRHTIRAALAGLLGLFLSLALPAAAGAGPIIYECGNGVVGGPVLCDDANTVDGDGCSANCIPEVCGDGILEVNGAAPDEECDDGNTIAGDGCGSDCVCEGCGDGFVCGAEECDDGNTIDDDACSSDCAHIDYCGNGVVEGPEECDDGNTRDDDTCNSSCLIVEIEYTPFPPDQRCVNAINRAWAKVIGTANRAAARCLRDVSRGKAEETFGACLASIDASKAFAKTVRSDEKECVGKVAAGMFGYVGDPAAVNLAGLERTLAAHVAVLGSPAMVAPKAEKPRARCQAKVQKGLVKYLDALAADSNRAKKVCLKGGKVPQCDKNSELEAAVRAPGRKAPKALTRWTATAAKKCADPAAIAADFPGACASSASPAELVTCASRRARCEFCASLNAADGLALDCDAYSGDPAGCTAP